MKLGVMAISQNVALQNGVGNTKATLSILTGGGCLISET
jgi:hypothetical protein